MPRRKPFEEVKDAIPSLAQRPGEEPRRERPWDESNPAFSFRIRPEDAQRLAAAAGDLGVSRDALARGLMQAALDALDVGWLALEVGQVVTEGTDKKGRPRAWVRRFVTPAWSFDRTSSSGDCGECLT